MRSLGPDHSIGARMGTGAGERRIQVIDSHTGGEPTRVVIDGGPDLGQGSASAKRDLFRDRFDPFRSAIVNEPRGSDVLVGALLTQPADPTCAAGVIFFNAVGYLGMCGHGTMGLVVTLAHLGRIGSGDHRIETPVGIVTARLHESGEVSLRNVPAYRAVKDVTLEVAGAGKIKGDVAWGGNWFFLTEEHGLDLTMQNIGALERFCWEVRYSIERADITASDGHEIDHVELSGPSPTPGAHSRNFVLCPGGAYDRSPCGTGTSAKLACLLADGQLRVGETWRQESITGSIFEGTVEIVDGEVIPVIKGRAFVNAEATLILNPADPCCWGIHSEEPCPDPC